MKYSKYIVAVLCLTLVGTLGCGNDAVPEVEVFLTSRFDVPSNVLLFEQGTIVSIDVRTQIDAQLSARGLSRGDVTSILPGRAVLRSRFNNVNLGFLRNVSVRAVSIADPTQVVEMFFLSEVRFDEGDTMELFSGSSELQQILLDDLFDIHLVVNYQNLPPGAVPLELDFSYLVFDE